MPNADNPIDHYMQVYGTFSQRVRNPNQLNEVREFMTRSISRYGKDSLTLAMEFLSCANQQPALNIEGLDSEDNLTLLIQGSPSGVLQSVISRYCNERDASVRDLVVEDKGKRRTDPIPLPRRSLGRYHPQTEYMFFWEECITEQYERERKRAERRDKTCASEKNPFQISSYFEHPDYPNTRRRESYAVFSINKGDARLRIIFDRDRSHNYEAQSLLIRNEAKLYLEDVDTVSQLVESGRLLPPGQKRHSDGRVYWGGWESVKIEPPQQQKEPEPIPHVEPEPEMDKPIGEVPKRSIGGLVRRLFGRR